MLNIEHKIYLELLASLFSLPTHTEMGTGYTGIGICLCFAYEMIGRYNTAFDSRNGRKRKMAANMYGAENNGKKTNGVVATHIAPSAPAAPINFNGSSAPYKPTLTPIGGGGLNHMHGHTGPAQQMYPNPVTLAAPSGMAPHVPGTGQAHGQAQHHYTHSEAGPGPAMV